MERQNEQPDVFVSLTTIPTRLDRTLEKTLASLLNQDYPNLKGVLVTIPLTNQRGQEWEFPVDEKHYPFLYQDERITIIRPDKDYGPIMKYLGSSHFFKKHEDVFLWVCDDDQEYLPTCVSDSVFTLCTHNRPDDIDHKQVVVANRGIRVLGMNGIRGFAGVLIHQHWFHNMYQDMDTQPKSCRKIDDDYVSAWLSNQKNPKAFVILKDRTYEQLFRDGTMNLATEDALHASHAKLWDRCRCLLKIEPTFRRNFILACIGVATVILITMYVIYLLYWYPGAT
jgi:cellulose synthase/poly-beta-1,6-N-acetylglucosamine synthase-like glycosyltransferase